MFHTPQHPLLQDSIVCYWLIEAESIPVQTKMLPDGHSDIMLNAGEPYAVERPDGSRETITGSALFGQRTGYLLLDQPGRVSMIGIRLRPGTEYLFTGIPAATFADGIVPLEQLIGEKVTAVEQQLRAPGITTEEKILLTEQLLLTLLRTAAAQPDERVEQVLSALLKDKGTTAIETLIAEAGFSYKQAERAFQKHLGLTPKRYARIVRFHHAFTQVRGKDTADWMDVLLRCGYYDQSHFIRDFRLFAGLPPGKSHSARDTLDAFFGFA